MREGGRREGGRREGGGLKWGKERDAFGALAERKGGRERERRERWNPGYCMCKEASRLLYEFRVHVKCVYNTNCVFIEPVTCHY